MAAPQIYCFHIRPRLDRTAEPQVISCTSERIQEIKRRSVVLKQLITDAGNCERIPLETDDEANINFDALRYLVEDLPLISGTNPGPVRLDVLSKHCSAFWKYQWMPESASILWAHRDQPGVETLSQHRTSPERCWKQRVSNQAQERSLYLINIAIVFGLDETLREKMDMELRQQIQISVWDSTSDIQLKTSVACLHNLEVMRREELKAIFGYFYHELVSLSEKHDKNVTQVRNRLKTSMDVNFCNTWSTNIENGSRLMSYTVYEFVGKIEYILVGSHENRARESGSHKPKVARTRLKPKDSPPVDWAAVTMATARESASACKNVFSYLSGSHEPKWQSGIQKMLDGAHTKIQERQKARADELIAWRNAESEVWKRALLDGNGIA